MIDHVLERIGNCADGRGAEARVARAILDDPERAINATLASLADCAQVSQASVVRFSRSMGFTGWPDLRLALAQILSRRALELEQSDIAEGTINDADSLHEVIQKVAFHEARSIEQTARSIDEEVLDHAAHVIAGGGATTALGVGASALVAVDLQQKLERIGLTCRFSQDTHRQLVHASMAESGSLVVGISFSGRTVEVEKGLALAAENGAMTVALTGDENSPVARTAQKVLVCRAREAEFRAGASASRMVQLAVIDFLFVRVAQLRLSDTMTALERSRRAVDLLRPERR